MGHEGQCPPNEKSGIVLPPPTDLEIKCSDKVFAAQGAEVQASCQPQEEYLPLLAWAILFTSWTEQYFYFSEFFVFILIKFAIANNYNTKVEGAWKYITTLRLALNIETQVYKNCYKMLTAKVIRVVLPVVPSLNKTSREELSHKEKAKVPRYFCFFCWHAIGTSRISCQDHWSNSVLYTPFFTRMPEQSLGLNILKFL